jgi:hypothetical protein
MLLHVRRWLNQKRLVSISFMKMNGTRCDISRFTAKVTLARRFRRAHFARRFHKNLRRMRHATGQASFEAETQNQSRR